TGPQLQDALGLLLRYSAQTRHLLDDLQLERGGADSLNVGLRGCQEPRAPFRSSDVRLCAQFRNQELRQKLARSRELLERVLSVLPYIAVRVVALRQEKEADGFVVHRKRQAHLERPPGGLASGGVAVEREHQLVGQLEK